MPPRLSTDIRQYLIITGNYWAFTLTDGALRMLVVLHFHGLGYSPLEIALLFLFYEFFGVVTNLIGGWLGARIGLNRTMNIGLAMQIVALTMLMAPASWLTVPWVMAAQALSGIAKDLNKMSAKSAVKSLVPIDAHSRLFKWVAFLTGSKNALKGIGFFLGGALLSILGFQSAMIAMAILLGACWLFSLAALQHDLGKASSKPKFREIFSKSRAVNILSAARLFLFASRDVWFVVALPVYLSETFHWTFWQTGGFLACWIIGYGTVQSLSPKILTFSQSNDDSKVDYRGAATRWAGLLALIPAAIAAGLYFQLNTYAVIIGGLLLFAIVFAVNSALHSFLIVHFASEDGASLDVGFYYMANAMGRLIGTVLSGAIFQLYGLTACLGVAAVFLMTTTLISLALPQTMEK
ncbi:MFS transporter [Hahella sp. CCB-MM4]|uniref:organoarsenical effux MFS transporter ArsJ n=1 Tax=Hahella sp. (strain CCB-MM4) TaxID=1926491 RepID=UPI000B9C0DB3|nr:organoarsenical effux MFS transporter ArsJ [Hahella sp. CCB-MM4]OZG73749.1 MFS transporter [Hahella sp. CCB-MM4]